MKTSFPHIQRINNIKKMIVFSCVSTIAVSAIAANVSPNNLPGNSSGGHHAQHHGNHKAAVNDSAEAELLRQAYDILRTGDHDYQGHRIKAMHRIEEAAKHMGVILRGDDKDKIAQPLSDERLRAARNLLAQVKISDSAKAERRIVWRIEEAITEINTALAIR